MIELFLNKKGVNSLESTLNGMRNKDIFDKIYI